MFFKDAPALGLALCDQPLTLYSTHMNSETKEEKTQYLFKISNGNGGTHLEIDNRDRLAG